MINEQMTTEEKEDNKLACILGREKEINDYQTNIDNYTETLSQLPTDDWPEEIVQYKKLRAAEDIASKVPPSLVDLVSQYSLRDHVKFLKTTETLEQNKANIFYTGAIISVKKISGDTDAQLNVKLAAKKIALQVELEAAK